MRYILSLLAACLLTTAEAQNLYVKVGATYGVSAADDNKRVSDKYAAGQDTLSTGLYWAWQRWKAEGMPYATFRSRYLGCAIAKDIAWRYEAASNIKSGYQNTYAFADWTDASGHWYANATMQIPRGGMEGQGSFGHYDDTQTSQVFATCEFEMTEDWWPANQTERRLFETPNSALGTPDAGSYNESFRIQGFRLQGPAIYGDGINRIGMFIRRPGECSYMNQVFAYQFQTGIMVVGGVPFTFGTLSAFFNERHGFAFVGTWGATITGQTLSGDDNGELLGIHPGYGDEAGGIINVNLLKNEAGIHAEGAGNPYRKHTVVYAEGQYTINIGVAAVSRNWITTDAAYIVNPRLTNGTPQNSVLRVGPTKGFNFRTALQNLAAGTRWAMPGDYQGFTFTHYAQGDRMYLNETLTPGTACNCPPLGFFRGSGTFDYVNCTPSNTGGPVTPPAGTWTCGQWGACVNGTQTRTCTCSGTCTTPKPAETQTCTQPPPPPPPTPTMTATVFCSAPADGYGSGDGSKLVDGNAGSYWLACRSMAKAQEVVVALGGSKAVKSIAFTKPPYYANSYPRKFTVWTSSATATTPPANSFTQRGGVFTNTGNASAVLPASVTCTYIKVVVDAVDPAWSGNYWGIAELTVQ